MATNPQPESKGETDDKNDQRLERDGVLLRGPYLPRGDQHKDETPHSTLWIDYYSRSSDLIKLRENGEYQGEEVLMSAEELPRLVEELIVRAYPDHADEIEQRVDRALGELREDSEDFEFTY